MTKPIKRFWLLTPKQRLSLSRRERRRKIVCGNEENKSDFTVAFLFTASQHPWQAPASVKWCLASHTPRWSVTYQFVIVNVDSSSLQISPFLLRFTQKLWTKLSFPPLSLLLCLLYDTFVCLFVLLCVLFLLLLGFYFFSFFKIRMLLTFAEEAEQGRCQQPQWYGQTHWSTACYPCTGSYRVEEGRKQKSREKNYIQTPWHKNIQRNNYTP